MSRSDPHNRSKSPEAHHLLRHAPQYLSATYLSRALCALRSLLNARWLGPELYGFWGSLSLALSFGFYLHGGVQDIAVRDIPMARSRGQGDLAERTARVSWTFFTALLLIAGAIFWLVAWCLPAGSPALIRWGVRVAGLVLPLEVLFLFEQKMNRAVEQFGHVSRALLIASLVSLGMTCWLVVAYGLVGLFVVAVLTPALGLWYLRRRASYPWRVTWSGPPVRAMLRAGWPILVMTVVFEALGWIDRLLVLAFVGMTGFGYYALATMLAQFCFLFPEGVASVVEPRLYFDYGRRRHPMDVRQHLWRSLKTLAWLMPLGLAVVDLLLPPFIHRWLPAYTPGIPAMRILVWGSILMGLAACTKSFLVALDQQRRVLPLYGTAIAVNILASVALVWRGWGLTGIALGTVAAYGTCCTGLLVVAFRCAGWSGRSIRARIASLYAPVAVVCALTVGLPALVRVTGLVAYGAVIGWRMVRRARADGSSGLLRHPEPTWQAVASSEAST